MKTLLTGVLAGIAMIAINFAFGWLVNLVNINIRNEYFNEEVFRPWTDWRMWLMFLQPFVGGLLLAFFWTLIRRSVPGRTLNQKSLNFGFGFFLVSVPGMIISYASFQVSGAMVLSWTLGNLLQAIGASQVVSRILKLSHAPQRIVHPV